ncbi:MAG: hypothetical protein J1E62_09195 [Lachnospiraceae bacterium]|nr:hypothetical protein [Lachnospiraceae bacterium]
MNFKTICIIIIDSIIILAIIIGVISQITSCTNMQARKKEIKKNLEELSAERLYPYANDTMAYTLSEDGIVQQWSLDGMKKKTFTLPTEGYDLNSTHIYLQWVGNKELLWALNTGKTSNFFSTAIHSSEKGQEIATTETNELFTTKKGISLNTAPVSVTDEYIVFYNNAKDTLYLYDRKKDGEPAKLNIAKNDFAYQPDYQPYFTASIDNRIVFHTGFTLGKTNADSYQFGEYQLDSKKTNIIDSRCFSGAAIATDSTNKKVYYQIIDDQSIWQYDCQTGETSELISEFDFLQCYNKNNLTWDDAYFNDKLFVEGNYIYFIKNVDNPIIFSYSLSENALSYEDALTEAVQLTKFPDRINDGTSELTIVESKLLLYQHSLNFTQDDYYDYCFCIEIPSGDIKQVKPDDPEYIYFDMVGMIEDNPFKPGNWKMPKNKEHETKYSRSHDKAEQLECISKNNDIWMNDDTDSEFQLSYNHFAVTDLDQNGQLEIIASTGLYGTGKFTATRFFQVSADGTTLRRIIDHAEDIDIVDALDTAYHDAKNKYYYVGMNLQRGGSTDYDGWYGAITLENGMLTDRTYAYQISSYNEEKDKKVVHMYKYLDGKEKEIKGTFSDSGKKLESEFFSGMSKYKVNISWFTLSDEERESQDIILEKLTNSCFEFKLERTEN